MTWHFADSVPFGLYMAQNILKSCAVSTKGYKQLGACRENALCGNIVRYLAKVTALACVDDELQSLQEVSR